MVCPIMGRERPGARKRSQTFAISPLRKTSKVTSIGQNLLKRLRNHGITGCVGMGVLKW